MAKDQNPTAQAPEQTIEELNIEELRLPVTDPVAPPSSPVPDLLPFDQRSWQDLEKVGLVVAEHVDGLKDVRLYGAPGQRQEGIDLFGWDDDGQAVDYQVKRYREFEENHLEAAVEAFADGRRPFDPKRLVLIVSCTADRWQVAETLARLRAAHDFEIDLYDRRRLSELLRNRHDLVRRLFGGQWADIFCGGTPIASPERSAAEVLADSLLRGPVVALGLEQLLNEAWDLADTDPVRAASNLRAVTVALDQQGFGGLGAGLRRKEAELLVRAGNDSEAAELLAGLAWREVERGGSFWDREALGRLRALAKDLGSQGGTSFVQAVDGTEQWFVQPQISLLDLVETARTMRSAGHVLADDVALWIAETALAIEDVDALDALATDLKAIVAGRESRGADDDLTVRARLCLADASGEWADLVRDARRGHLGRRLCSLVHARRGRSLALTARPSDAEDAFREAVDQACMAHLPQEAGQALRSILDIQARYGPLTDLNEIFKLALAVEGTGPASFLGRQRDPHDAGMAALAEDRPPEALRWFRTDLRDSVITGHLAGELDAHRELGRLLAKVGEVFAALPHAIRGGDTKLVEAILPQAEHLPVGHPLLVSRRPWVRATALLAEASQADLIRDEDVAPTIDLALAATEGDIQAPLGPQVWVNAWKLVRALGQRMTEAQAADALDRLERQIAREPNHYRWNDDEHIAIVADVLTAQPSLAERATDHLVRLLEQGGQLAEDVRSKAGDALHAAHERVLPELERLANAEHPVALRLLLDFGVTHPKLVSDAERQLAAELNRPEPEPGCFDFGSLLPRTSYVARVLPEEDRIRLGRHALGIASDPKEAEPNRTEAMQALRVLARELPDEVRDEFFAACFCIATHDVELSAVDRELMGGLHPLSTMRINLDWGSLQPTALRAAAGMARSDDQYEQVVPVAFSLLTRSERHAYAGAHALAMLPPGHVTVDLALLSGLQAVWARQLAAVLWVHHPGHLPGLGHALAHDADPSVRRSLASGLDTLQAVDPEIASEIRAVLSQDPHWTVRHRAATAGDSRSSPG